jgi:hypothetical protein
MTLLAAPVWLTAASPDFTGHREGSVRTPDDEFPFIVDLVADANGVVSGTTRTHEANGGFPLKVEVNKLFIQFHARTDQSFDGVLSEDGQTITGNHYLLGHTLPYTLERTGDAKIEAPLPGPAIQKELAGIWEGSFELKGQRMRFLLSLRNEGAVSFGKLVSLDEGDLTIPVQVHAVGTAVKLSMPAVNGTFEGSLDTAGQLAGTLRQGKLVVPITFRAKE